MTCLRFSHSMTSAAPPGSDLTGLRTTEPCLLRRLVHGVDRGPLDVRHRAVRRAEEERSGRLVNPDLTVAEHRVPVDRPAALRPTLERPGVRCLLRVDLDPDRWVTGSHRRGDLHRAWDTTGPGRVRLRPPFDRLRGTTQVLA